MTPFVHGAAICESDQVGDGTRVWAFVHVRAGAVIGADCNLCDGVFVENDVLVGNRVTVKSGVQLLDGVRLGDDVFVGPNATFTNDPFPRSRQQLESFPPTIVHAGASIGANATILPGVTIGREAMVGAGAVVTRDVPAHAKVMGNPARSGPLPRDVHVVAAPRHTDLRGSTGGEFGDLLSFTPVRYVVIDDLPSRHDLDGHADRACSRYVTCLTGSVVVHVDDGRPRADIELQGPGQGVVVPPMGWASRFGCGADAILLVLASHPNDADDEVRDDETFLAEAGLDPPE